MPVPTYIETADLGGNIVAFRRPGRGREAAGVGSTPPCCCPAASGVVRLMWGPVARLWGRCGRRLLALGWNQLTDERLSVTLHPSMMQMFPEDSPRRVLETGMAGPCRASRNQGVMCLVGGEHAKESRLPEGWSWGMAMGELSDFQERHRGEPRWRR